MLCHAVDLRIFRQGLGVLNLVILLVLSMRISFGQDARARRLIERSAC
jgi:hypothetical protein